LGGYAQHAPYAPCTVQALASKGYDYWALGHVHEREVLSRDPWIVFPGNLQGRHARETGAKGATLVEVIDGQVASVRHLALDALRWLRVEVACDGATTVEEVQQRIREALARARAEEAEEFAAVARVILTGTSPLAPALSDRRALLRDEVRAIAQAADELWVEKVVLEVTLPVSDAEGAVEDAASLLDEALGDPELVELLAADLKPFLDAAPAETAETGGLHEAAREKRWSELLAAASVALRERLNGGAA
jgi:DNA repair exonuclease SbcCD nuclease subunit